MKRPIKSRISQFIIAGLVLLLSSTILISPANATSLPGDKNRVEPEWPSLSVNNIITGAQMFKPKHHSYLCTHDAKWGVGNIDEYGLPENYIRDDEFAEWTYNALKKNGMPKNMVFSLNHCFSAGFINDIDKWFEYENVKYSVTAACEYYHTSIGDAFPSKWIGEIQDTNKTILSAYVNATNAEKYGPIVRRDSTGKITDVADGQYRDIEFPQYFSRGANIDNYKLPSAANHENYAIIFVGSVDPHNEERFEKQAKDLFKTLTTQYHYNPDKIEVCFAEGKSLYKHLALKVGEKGDIDHKGTKAGFEAALTNVARNVKDKDLLIWTYDHGDQNMHPLKFSFSVEDRGVEKVDLGGGNQKDLPHYEGDYNVYDWDNKLNEVYGQSRTDGNLLDDPNFIRGGDGEVEGDIFSAKREKERRHSHKGVRANELFVDEQKLGLLDTDNLNGMSRGKDYIPPNINKKVEVLFSVEDWNNPGTTVLEEREGMPGSAVRDQSERDEVPGDLFEWDPNEPHDNELYIEECELGLRSVLFPPGDSRNPELGKRDDANVDALEEHAFKKGPDKQVYFTVDSDAKGNAGAVQNEPDNKRPGNIYLSKLDDSNEIFVRGVWHNDGKPVIGLKDDDDIDGFALYLGKDAKFDKGEDVILFSLAPYSPTLFGEDGQPGVAGEDDDGNGIPDNVEEWMWGGSEAAHDDLSAATIFWSKGAVTHEHGKDWGTWAKYDVLGLERDDNLDALDTIECPNPKNKKGKATFGHHGSPIVSYDASTGTLSIEESTVDVLNLSGSDGLDDPYSEDTMLGATIQLSDFQYLGPWGDEGEHLFKGGQIVISKVIDDEEIVFLGAEIPLLLICDNYKETWGNSAVAYLHDAVTDLSHGSEFLLAYDGGLMVSEEIFSLTFDQSLTGVTQDFTVSGSVTATGVAGSFCVPEPGTIVLVGCALVVLAGVVRRKMR